MFDGADELAGDRPWAGQAPDLTFQGIVGAFSRGDRAARKDMPDVSWRTSKENAVINPYEKPNIKPNSSLHWHR